jgi:hydrophobic/amphiphilic exporter-1 (mainly G- bacteria), HAE1 family
VSLSDLSIQRPVLTWMMTLALATFGVLGFSRLGVDRYPNMEFPFVGVSVELEGAAPSVLEDEVVDPLEESFATIQGVRHIRSEATQGAARVMLEFELGHDLDTAAQDVRDKLNATMRRLPRDIEPPSLGKADYSQFPVIYAPISSDLPETVTTEYVDRQIKPLVESIPGAAGVSLFGARKRNIRIWIDPAALRARQLAVSDVLGALRREHVERPGGFVEGHAVEWALKTDAEFRSVGELENMIVSWDGEAPIRLRDLARLEDGGEDVRDATYMNGKKGIALGLTKQSRANTVAIVDEFYKRMDAVRGRTPDGISISKKEGFIDFSRTIRESFEETMFALVFGGLLAVFVVFVFMRRSRPTMIVAAAIPLSLIAAFGMIWVFDFTLNTMTLLGLTLAIGVVIDDAIIVLENIERHREQGKNAHEAAVSGTREITFAAMAATFSVAAVFLPVAFGSGRMGAFLREFGITVSVAVMVSLFVALTLTPMLAARMPPPKPRGPGSIYHRLERWFHGLETGYRNVLDWTLAHRGKTALIAVASVVVAIIAGKQLPGEFFPSSDSGFVLMQFRTPPGTSLEATEAILVQNQQWLLAQPETAAVFGRIGSDSYRISGPNQGMINARLVPREERKRSAQEIMRAAREALAQIPGQEISVANPMSSGSRDFEVEVAGNASLEELDQYSSELIDRLRASGGLVDLDKSLRLGLPEARVVPDRDKAAALGIDAATVAEIVQAMIGGLDVATFRDGEQRHDIRLRMERQNRDSLDAVGDLWVRTRGGQLVDLRNLVRIEKGASAAMITRTDRQRSVKVMASLDGISLDAAVARAQKIAAEILPPHLSLKLTGDAEAMKEAGSQFVMMLVLAVLVIYMVLAAQFESFAQPLIVMIALPFSMVGALGGLWLGGMSLNLFSMIGIVLLIGLVTKNSILLIDYANQLRAEGQSPVDAIRHAAPIRMRPVVMTALAMIFGVLPSAFGIGPGAETRAPMAVATAAGMFTSTMLTLLVVPVFYLALDDVKAFFANPWPTLARWREAARGLRPLAARYLGSGTGS